MLSPKLLILLFAAIEFNMQSFVSLNLNNRTRKATAMVNHAPVFSSNNYSFSISEKASLGSAAGNVSATDQDGDPLTYSITAGNTNSALKINPSTGSITIFKRLDHHAQDRYNLTIKVKDPAGLSDQSSVVITVVAEAPVSFNTITWSNATNQPYGTHEVHGEVVNGKLYVFGGFDVEKRPKYVPTKRAFVFDPVAKTWTRIADLPHNPKGTNFGGVTHMGLATDGTDIYFAGGYPSNSTGSAQAFSTKEVWRYNVASNTYTALPNLPAELAAGQLRYLKGRLHYMGGANKSRDDIAVHYVLNLDNLTAGWKTLASLTNPSNHPGAAVYEGKIYFLGGAHHQDSKSIKQKIVEVYNPATNTWSRAADLPKALDHISSSVIVIGNRILVLGGETAPSVRSKEVYAYTPANNSWSSLTPMPSAKSAGVAAVLNGTMYFTGGNYSSTNYKGVPVIQGNSIIVDNITLINADTDQPIKTLNNGDILNLATLPTENLNISAIANPANVRSVLFNLSGQQTKNATENSLPYALFGDNSGNYNPWTPAVGDYTLKVTPFSASGAGGTAGPSKTVTFTVINSATQNVILLPVADAFVRNGEYSETEFGLDTTLEVKTITSSGFTRYAYLKFSLSNISSVGTATLRLYGSNTTNTEAIRISAYGVSNDSWLEDQIEFDNAPPPLSTSLSSETITNVPKYYEFDVTDFVKTQFTGDKIVSLFVKDPKNSDLKFIFNSRENENNAPQLVIDNSGQNKPSVTQTFFSQPSYRTIKTKVYPNPVQKKLNVEFAKDYTGSYDLQIVDPIGKIYQLGKHQLKQGVYDMEVDISKLSLKTGIYFLRIRYDTNETEIIKLVAK